jgi:acyl-CoA thioesterase FadM
VNVQHPDTEVTGRPRFEGANIGTWIGFKHVMYLIEEAVLAHLRTVGLAPGRLYEEHGLGVEIVDSDVRIRHALHVDDQVRSLVEPGPPDGGELTFAVSSFVDRRKAVTARVRVVLRGTADGSPVPTQLRPFVTPVIARADAAAIPERASAGRFAWKSKVPYFYCHFSARLQHSGYVRVLEEAVDRFLADRGVSIATMLGGRRWIPVVPHARVQVLGEALMEEELHTVFTVQDVFKCRTYTASMDCYVRRGGRMLRTATGSITHGYAEIISRRDWQLVSLDWPTITALTGAREPA